LEYIRKAFACFQTAAELHNAVKNYIFGSQSQYCSDIGDWCVGDVKDFSGLFYDPNGGTYYDSFNEDISKWNTTSVKDMSNMFRQARGFNIDLASWDVSSVTAIYEMYTFRS
jgi:surface protein